MGVVSSHCASNAISFSFCFVLEDSSIVGLDIVHNEDRIDKTKMNNAVLCADTKDSLMLLVIRLRIAVSPAWYVSHFVFFFLCWRTLCLCWIRRFVCLLYFSNTDCVDAPLVEAGGITVAVPGSLSATHV